MEVTLNTVACDLAHGYAFVMVGYEMADGIGNRSVACWFENHTAYIVLDEFRATTRVGYCGRYFIHPAFNLSARQDFSFERRVRAGL